MIGNVFVIFFWFSIIFLVIALFFSKKSKKRAIIFQIFGALLFLGFMVWLMFAVERPPVLQSVWFIPHVAAYMVGYIAISCAVLLGCIELFNNKFSLCSFVHTWCTLWLKKSFTIISQNIPTRCDFLVKIGTIALGFGLCFGALWAKKAWGQYWSWDIKETAALITWLIFLLYIHLQKLTKIKRKFLFIILLIGFLSLQFTWFGVKLLPAAQKSPHTFYRGE